MGADVSPTLGPVLPFRPTADSVSSNDTRDQGEE